MQDSNAFRIHVGWADLDPIAVGIIVILTVLICLSTKESSRTNLVLVITKLLGVVFVIIAGDSATSLCKIIPTSKFVCKSAAAEIRVCNDADVIEIELTMYQTWRLM